MPSSAALVRSQDFLGFLKIGRCFLDERQSSLSISDDRREGLFDFMSNCGRSCLKAHELIASFAFQVDI
jgi:hypothetical protein